LKKDESKVNEFVVSKLSDSRENLISFSIIFLPPFQFEEDKYMERFFLILVLLFLTQSKTFQFSIKMLNNSLRFFSISYG
jgi:hypothetical protein